ncbi:exopolysaccharide transport family protein [Filomicrobium sp.]|uniref:GumC family protein n=1 Tax=Filomicrobium sp. TaxID=2024831 RepID=UPI002582B24F|nr:exopolysaccharide transport family protein [Filomicrobium sp.]MCV0370272.1 exopolysaccharide transport family protein [Filomicrobium sp.]
MSGWAVAKCRHHWDGSSGTLGEQMRQNETRIWDVVVRDPQAGHRPSNVNAAGPAESFMKLDPREFVGLAKRHWRMIGMTTIGTAVVVTAIALALPKYYEASTRMLIDPRGLDVIDKGVTPGPATVEQGSALVESEVHFLSSDSVLSKVIAKHNLVDDPEFNGTDGGPLSFITDSIATVRAGVESALGMEARNPPAELITLQSLRESIFAMREPTSYTVDIGIATKSPQKSADIANWITEEYLTTRLSTRASATARAGQSLVGRLDELRNDVEVAESKVEDFKRAYDIFTASGQLVTEQQLSELNTQLGNARAETLRARSRLEQIRSLASAGLGPDATLEALSSENIRRLREQYATVRQRQAALGSQLLPSHPAMRQVSQEVAIAKRQLDDELKRIEQTAQLDLDRAMGNERKLEIKLAEAKKISSETNDRLVKLRELEREAEARRSVYSAFLLRSRELSEQQRVDSSMVTVISPAVPPRRHKGLPLALVGIAGLLTGLGLGVGAALWRDIADKKLRSDTQLATLSDGWTVAPLPNAAGVFPQDGQTASTNDDDGGPDAASRLRDFASEIRFAIGPHRGAAVLVTSADADKDAGLTKSAFAANLAVAAAEDGDRVLLIDANPDTALLSRRLQLADRNGLIEVAEGDLALGKAINANAIGSVSVLALGKRPQGLGVALDPEAIRKVIVAAEDDFDLIVLDGGILMRERSLRGLVSLASQIVVVAREGQSDKPQLRSAFQALHKWHVEKGRAVIVAA